MSKQNTAAPIALSRGAAALALTMMLLIIVDGAMVALACEASCNLGVLSFHQILHNDDEAQMRHVHQEIRTNLLTYNELVKLSPHLSLIHI